MTKREWVSELRKRGWRKNMAESIYADVMNILEQSFGEDPPKSVRFGKIGRIIPEEHPGRTVVRNFGGKAKRFHLGSTFKFKFQLFREFRKKVSRLWFASASEAEWPLLEEEPGSSSKKGVPARSSSISTCESMDKP